MRLKLILIFLLFTSPLFAQPRYETGQRIGYVFNREPLVKVPFAQLPLGAIEPQGWILEQLNRQATGLTGNLDKVYTRVVGPRNGWLGGDGDGWERGPYWIDGLLPLAYLLDDEVLIAKVQPWIEWSIANQTAEGYFGPVPFDQKPPDEPGLQKTRRRDWWPKMVMLKIMQQHYMATGDDRVIDLLTRYFRYQLENLPSTPLDTWSFWANRRGGDNMMVVYWLYNLTGDEFLLDLAQILNDQTYPYTDMFLKGDVLSSMFQFHCVNLAQGFKQPAIYYQQDPHPRHVEALKKGFADLYKYHGQPQGMYGGDEPLHGQGTTQGSELCSTVEMMFSLENMLQIFGDPAYADHLERVAYNSLPTQIDDQFTTKQYYQQPNQVRITWGDHNFHTDNPHRLVYGTTTGYPCCTTNMHQGWPKLVNNLWYASLDSGLAALMYAPCEVNALVADGKQVTITEKTRYPFENTVRFEIQAGEPVAFPLHLRIPGWCHKAVISVNGETWDSPKAGQIIKIDRIWSNNDEVELLLPMQIAIERYYKDAASIVRGPLVYALKIDEHWKYTESAEHPPGYYQVLATSPWNYGLDETVIKDPEKGFEVMENPAVSDYPWTLDDAPIALKTTGVRIDEWQLYNAMAGPIPVSPVRDLEKVPRESITLIPYGCTTLRISEFPVVR